MVFVGVTLPPHIINIQNQNERHTILIPASRLWTLSNAWIQMLTKFHQRQNRDNSFWNCCHTKTAHHHMSYSSHAVTMMRLTLRKFIRDARMQILPSPWQNVYSLQAGWRHHWRLFHLLTSNLRCSWTQRNLRACLQMTWCGSKSNLCT